MISIGFRAWDIKNKRMIFNPSLIYDGEYYVEYEGELYRLKNESGSQPYRFILMQSTGLLDKNGNEIYEGDIVYRHRIDRLGNKGGGKYKIVERVEKRNSLGWSIAIGETRNVIGNIYENPELVSKLSSK